MFFKIVINNDNLTNSKSKKQDPHKESKTLPKEPVHITKDIVDENDHMIGKCIADIFCMDVTIIETIWVEPKYRMMGLGAELLEKVEQESRDNGCSAIHLDTFDEETKEFFIHAGYEVYGVLEDCPKDHSRYYIKKEF